MRKLLFLSLLFLFFNDHSFAQDSLKEYIDTKYHRVLLIPFNMTYYLSDADHAIAEYNGMTLSEVQHSFRHSLDLNMHLGVVQWYDSKRLLTDADSTSQADLERLYNSISYRYSKPLREVPDEEEIEVRNDVRSWVKRTFGTKETTQEVREAEFSDGMIKKPVPERRYMHAHLKQAELLQELALTYDTDLFLLINQFEIKTNYEHCLDRATNNFVREISVHYSIYDAEARLLDGDVVTVLYPSNSNKIEDIIKVNLGNLSAEVTANLPENKWTKEED